MLIKTYGSAVHGVRATTITIEVNISQGIRFFIVGLADNAIRESQQRIESALSNNGFEWPRYKVVINMAPADMRKEGTHFELPLAIGILAASNQFSTDRLDDYLILGELSLDGSVMPVRGVLPMVLPGPIRIKRTTSSPRPQGHPVLQPSRVRGQAPAVHALLSPVQAETQTGLEARGPPRELPPVPVAGVQGVLEILSLVREA